MMMVAKVGLSSLRLFPNAAAAGVMLTQSLVLLTTPPRLALTYGTNLAVRRTVSASPEAALRTRWELSWEHTLLSLTGAVVWRVSAARGWWHQNGAA